MSKSEETVPLLSRGGEDDSLLGGGGLPLVQVMRTSYQSIEDADTTFDVTATNLHCHTRDKARKAGTKAAQRKLIIASVVCLLFMIGEFVGGYVSNSLAIMTDAAHLLSDFGGFMISLFALYLGSRKPSKRLSFGWYRAEVMGALMSVLIIWVLTGILVYEAINRIQSGDYQVDPVVMLITSGVGVLVNIILGATLHGSGAHTHGLGGGHGHSHGGDSSAHSSGHHSHETSQEHHGHSHGAGGDNHGHSHGAGGDNHGHSHATDGNHGHSHANGSVPRTEGHGRHEHEGGATDAVLEGAKKKMAKDLNVRAAFIHVIGDLVQSIGVFFAALLIYFKRSWMIADPICTFLFSVLVLATTLTILKDIVQVLMEGTPKGLDFNEVFQDLRSIRGVRMVHNLHVWSLTMGTAALSVHLAIDADARSTHSVLREAQTLVAHKYEIHHSTIQVEKFHKQMDDCSMCEEPND